MDPGEATPLREIGADGYVSHEGNTKEILPKINNSSRASKFTKGIQRKSFPFVRNEDWGFSVTKYKGNPSQIRSRSGEFELLLQNTKGILVEAATYPRKPSVYYELEGGGWSAGAK